jgi:RNA-directed DNA polymerase
MHDPEKSDSGIVVTKPTNKAGRPVAEPVEPRPGTKGNADQQSTHRAQSRARVTQALGRVRRAARQRKKEKFTASSTISVSIRSGRRSTRLSAKPSPAWMV